MHRSCYKESQPRQLKELKTINIVIGYFFFINSVIGVGFLGIPMVFYGAGFLTSLLTLLVISLLAYVTMTWLLEVMSRAQAIEDTRHEANGDQCSHLPNFRIEITRKFEQGEMCELFVHKWLKYFYTLVISVGLLSGLWAYCTVAGQAWSVNLPLHFGPFNECADSLFDSRFVPEDSGCLASYRFCLLLFSLIVVPLSLLDLKEQSAIQIAMGVVRFTLLGCMILYCLVKLIQEACSSDSHTLSNCTTIDIASLTAFDFRKWLAAIPVMLYAQALHPSTVPLSHPIRQKKQLHWLVLLIFLTTTFLYSTLGTLASLWFGAGTLNVVTLNWFPYTKPGHSMQLRILSYLIVLFPSLDVCTIYPLAVYTLVNNVFLVVMGKDTSQSTLAYEWWIRLAMKAGIAVLPIMCAMFVANLLSVLTYAGLISFLNFFFFPSILQLASQRMCVKKFRRPQTILNDHDTINCGTQWDERTPLIGADPVPHGCGQAVYTTPYSIPGLSHPLAVVAISVVGAALFVLTFVGAVQNS